MIYTLIIWNIYSLIKLVFESKNVTQKLKNKNSRHIFNENNSPCEILKKALNNYKCSGIINGIKCNTRSHTNNLIVIKSSK